MSAVVDNWWLMALVAPFAYALSCVIDVCCVGERIFRFPSDGPIVSCLFWLFPLAIVATDVGGWNEIEIASVLPALASGLCYFLQMYFYFRALFRENDASRAEVFNTLGILFVPMLAFVVTGETLSPAFYVAVTLAVGGLFILLRGRLASTGLATVVLLTASVFFGSLSMVLDAWVFDRLPYWNGVMLTALGSFVSAVAATVISMRRTRHIAALCRRFSGLFLCAEVIHLLGALAGQRATAIGPSVSLVALAECVQPAFVVVLSVALVATLRRRVALSSDIRHALALQSIGASAKFASISLIAAAIFVVNV